MQEFEFYQPASLAELSGLLAESGRKILAGGTDLIPRIRQNHCQVSSLVDVSQLTELRFINEDKDWINIGSLVRHYELQRSALLKDAALSLVEAASSIGSPQTRRRGTLGGNLCNASPAADLAPALLTLGTKVDLYKKGICRSIDMKDFFLAPGKTAVESDEILLEIRFSRPEGTFGTAFLKTGKRKGMAVSITSAAAMLKLNTAGEIESARVALGSVAPVPMLSPSVEKVLVGQKPGKEIFGKAAEACKQDIKPIGDIRSSAAYRLHAATVLVERTLTLAAGRAQNRRTA